MLEASGLEAGYLGENVVEGVDLRVAAGEAVAADVELAGYADRR